MPLAIYFHRQPVRIIFIHNQRPMKHTVFQRRCERKDNVIRIRVGWVQSIWIMLRAVCIAYDSKRKTPSLN